jgi:predicted nucleic acid-binding protein
VIVLDSSAAVDLLLGFDPQASWVEAELDAAAWDLHAPHVIDVEVSNAFRRVALRGHVTRSRARQGLDILAQLPLIRYPHVHLLERMWKLRDVLAAGDASFVALAEALDAPLVTTDAGLGRARGHNALVVTFA